MRAAPNDLGANQMRAMVLSGLSGAWEAGPRSAAELKKAATHFDRAAALSTAPAWKVELSSLADQCRSAQSGGCPVGYVQPTLGLG